MRLLVLLISLTLGAAAQIIPFERGYQPGGLIPFANSWEGPVALELKAVDGGRSGKVWFRETADGVLLFGRILGGPTEWARFPAEMSARNHVDVWLRAAADVRMPETAWGNQFNDAVTCLGGTATALKSTILGVESTRALVIGSSLSACFSDAGK